MQLNENQKNKALWTYSWEDEESFLDSSLRSESFPKSKGPNSFCNKIQ